MATKQDYEDDYQVRVEYAALLKAFIADYRAWLDAWESNGGPGSNPPTPPPPPPGTLP